VKIPEKRTPLRGGGNSAKGPQLAVGDGGGGGAGNWRKAESNVQGKGLKQTCVRKKIREFKEKRAVGEGLLNGGNVWKWLALEKRI